MPLYPMRTQDDLSYCKVSLITIITVIEMMQSFGIVSFATIEAAKRQDGSTARPTSRHSLCLGRAALRQCPTDGRHAILSARKLQKRKRTAHDLIIEIKRECQRSGSRSQL
ncbi:uncharacterized protein LOC105426964 isoform X1 [Pogonomyrmex barbatus]|uniref:Uncharacterized protein LOC105426964 isoform X1 n=1 Tax=Pogonomyrmex barbatus TaxID=144034 RepID=A0A6I9W4A6_9HYME|nr:uncharacterized protein LOC105426964 isoform X1 [Pogonomyrmex barbatus]